MKKKDKTIKIIFLGTPKFGAIILEKLIRANFKPILVITAPDKPVGRKQITISSAVKMVAQKYNIPLEQPSKIENCKLKIENLKPNLIIVAAYNQILPKEILKIPKYGCLNIHPSLLPKYRGPTPIQFAILNGDKKTGVTIILMDEKIDHGPILAQQELEFLISNFQFSNLHDKLAKLGADFLIETIPQWLKGKIKPKPQNHSQATYTKILKKDDGKINWKKSSEEIERQIRAFEIWPGSFTFWQKNNKLLRIKILKAKILKSIDSQNYFLGQTLISSKNELSVRCKKGFLIIEKLQLEGKKEMTSKEFIRGHPDFIGTILKYD